MANQVAYGFVGLDHLFSQRVTEIGVDVIRNAVLESTRAYNEEINALIETWAERSTTIKERVELPGAGTLQPIDEYGNPLPVRPSGNYDVGYPIQGGGTAWGTNRITAALISVEEANDYTTDAFRRDATWMRAHLLAAILDNTGWTFGDKALGDVNVTPLANGDSTVYLKLGANQPSTDNHYFYQAASISNAANPFPVIYQALLEHPSNSEPFVVYVPTNLVDEIEALSAFVPQQDPDVTLATTRDRLANVGTAAIQGPGDMILGKANRVWVVEWRALPDNYMIGVALGAAPFLRMREYPAGQLQGLFPEFHSQDGNTIENRFLRYTGFGVRNRVAAVAYRVGSGSYAVPAAYDAPLP